MANSLLTPGAIKANSAPKPSPEEKRWRAEDDMRTLMRADEIKSDKSRLKACQDHAKRAATVTKATSGKRK